ncbi:hypothetical protein V7111_16380 [Neobacillus niacini]|uniref:hypothetical protein n=1 Tax=Neobacillus niacini TaxID=86668 RepID=UPI0030032B6B
MSALSLYSPFLILGLILFLLGFIGIYGGIFLKAGVSGLIGFALLFIFFLIYEMTTYTLTISVSPVIFDGVTTEQSFTEANSFMVNVFDHSDFKYFIFIIPTTLIGLITFGFGTLKSKVLPKWTSYTMFATALAPIFGFIPVPFLQVIFSSGIFYLSLICYGIVVALDRESEDSKSSNA